MANQENSRAVSLIKTMLDPQFQRVDVAPDIGRSGVASFVGNVDYSLTYNIAANAATNPGTPTVLDPVPNPYFTDIVPYQRGMYIAFPQYGVDRVFHYGFVEAGSYIRVGLSTLTQSGSRLRIQNSYVGPKTAISANNFVGYSLTFNADLALPRVGQGIGFQIEPELESNYSKLRAFASKMVLSSTTISGSNFNLSGTFSSGVIADTRDICQITGANGVSRAFPVAALSQQSITKGDVLRTSSVAEGAVDLMGPDYPRMWTQPRNDVCDVMEAQWQKMNIANTNKVILNNVALGALGATGSVYDIFQYWVTPWDTDMWVSNGTTTSVASQKPTNQEVVRCAPINEDGVLDIDVNFSPRVGWGNATDQALQHNLTLHTVVNAVHVFAYAGTNGLVNYNTFGETQQFDADFHSAQFGAGASENAINGVFIGVTNCKCKFRPARLRPGFAVSTGGKYVGTLISMTSNLTNASFEPASSTTMANPAGNIYAQVSDIGITVAGRTADTDGRVGIAHIIRYDDVTEGQQIQFQGSAIIQGVAQGKLQPFVTRSIGTLTIPDTMLTKLLDILWGRSERFRRICTLRDYRERILPFSAELSGGSIADIIAKLDPDERVVANIAANAAGIFGGLGEGIGSLFGLGDVGRALGGIGDKVFGTGSATFDQQPWEGKSDTVYMRGNELLGGAGLRRGRDQ